MYTQYFLLASPYVKQLNFEEEDSEKDNDDISPNKEDNPKPGCSKDPDNIFDHSLPIEPVERQQLYNEITNLRTERNELALLNTHSCFSFKALKKDPTKSSLLTGLKFDVLETLLDYLLYKVDYGKFTKEQLFDQILLTMIKLKQNLSFELIAYIYMELSNKH